MTSLLDRLHPRSCLSPGGCGAGDGGIGIGIGIGIGVGYPFGCSGRSDGASDFDDNDRHDALHRTAARLLRDIDDYGDVDLEEDGSDIDNNDAAATATASSSAGTGRSIAAMAAATYSRRGRKGLAAQRRRRLNATKKLFKLSVAKENRVPLVCTSRLDVLSALVACVAMAPSSEECTAAFGRRDGNGNGEDRDGSTKSNRTTHRLHEDDADVRRWACLTLNNLSIPDPNKAVMSLGQHSDELLTALVQNIESASPESHLCAICLYNLSFLDDAADVLLNFCPVTSDGDAVANVTTTNGSASASPTAQHHHCGCDPLSTSLSSDPINSTASTATSVSNENGIGSARGRSSPVAHHRIGSTALRARCHSPSFSNRKAAHLHHHHHYHQRHHQHQCPLTTDRSLLRILEAMVRTYSPFLLSPVASVEGESVRWTVGLMSNLVAVERRANIVLQTDIPHHIVQNLKNTPRRSINEWTEESTEEMSLIFMCNLIRFGDGRDALARLDADAAIRPALGKGGIHSYRAGLIHCALVGNADGDGDGDDAGGGADPESGGYLPCLERSDTMGEF